MPHEKPVRTDIVIYLTSSSYFPHRCHGRGESLCVILVGYTMKKIRRREVPLSQKIKDVLVGYATTQLILMAVVAIVSVLLLSLIGVQFPVLLGIMTGSLSVVPVLGMTVAAVIVATVAIFDGIRFLPQASVLWEGGVMILVYGLLNFFVDYFLSPYLVGKTSGVHPMVLLLFVLIGSFALGIWGAVLTVPVILVAKTISAHYMEKSRVR